MLLGMFIGTVILEITLFAHNGSILLTKHKTSSFLQTILKKEIRNPTCIITKKKSRELTYEANITERKVVGRISMVEREAVVFGGELVSMVDTVVAGGA